jgi:hypothetical protein
MQQQKERMDCFAALAMTWGMDHLPQIVIVRHRVSPGEPDDRLQRTIQYS